MKIPAVLVGLFCAGALAASMSSGDTMVHAAASILVRDGWIAALKKRLIPMREKALIRWMVVAVMLLSYLVAVLYTGSLVALLLKAYGAVVQFMPALFATLYFRRSSGIGVLAGIVTGSLTTLAFVLWPDLRPWALHAGLYGLVVNVVALVAVSLFTRPVIGVEEESFLQEAAE
jgi:SSS family solute:Na+ symporter